MTEAIFDAFDQTITSGRHGVLSRVRCLVALPTFRDAIRYQEVTGGSVANVAQQSQFGYNATATLTGRIISENVEETRCFLRNRRQNKGRGIGRRIGLKIL